jgi:shikimate dehydrogenase
VAEHAGVLGRPIAHSLSPILHRAAYAELGLDWSYEAIECGVAELPATVAQRADWAGFSATMPLKHALLDVAAEVRPIAATVGSANTLLRGPDGWIAENTDVAGIVAALAEHSVAPGTVTILGAGGTAQAMLAALLAVGVEECTVLARDPTRAAALVATAERLGVRVRVDHLDNAAAALTADLVASTLPPGAADRLAEHIWRPHQSVFDVVYTPWPTPFVASAARAGARVVSGALMLLHQAAVQVALMTGHEAPVVAMRAALAHVAPDCGI